MKCCKMLLEMVSDASSSIRQHCEQEVQFDRSHTEVRSIEIDLSDTHKLLGTFETAPMCEQRLQSVDPHARFSS